MSQYTIQRSTTKFADLETARNSHRVRKNALGVLNSQVGYLGLLKEWPSSSVVASANKNSATNDMILVRISPGDEKTLETFYLQQDIRLHLR